MHLAWLLNFKEMYENNSRGSRILKILKIWKFKGKFEAEFCQRAKLTLHKNINELTFIVVEDGAE